MLLAAGRGERLRPLTLERPKPLLQVRGRALIDYHLERLAAVGVAEVVINVSWLSEQIVEHCGDGARWGLAIRYSREAEPLETAGGIIEALPLLGDAPFLLVNADIYTDYPFGGLVGQRLDAGAARLVLVDNPSHNAAGDFSLHDGQVSEPAGATLTYAGIGLYDPGFFAGVPRGKRPLRPLLGAAIAEGRLFGEAYAGLWTDVGTPRRLADVNGQDCTTRE